MRYTHHIFVCTNERPEGHPKGCCQGKGSAGVLEKFRELIKERRLNHLMRANAAGCLSNCEKGISVVVYPEGVWYSRVQLTDVEEIFNDHILNGRVVERLKDYQEKLET